MKKVIIKPMPATIFLPVKSVGGRLFPQEPGAIIATTAQTAFQVCM